MNRAVTQMDQGVQATAAQAEELSGTAQTLSSQAVQLEALVSRFRLDKNDKVGGTNAGPIGVDLKKAVKAHVEWKTRLRAYITHPDGSLDPAVVGRRNGCPLGQWLEGEGRQWSSWPEYSDLVAEHARFHQEAAAIASLAAEHSQDEAQARLASQSGYGAISAKVILLIEQLSARLAGTRPAPLARPPAPARARRESDPVAEPVSS